MENIKRLEMSYEEFITRYEPIDNHLNEQAAFDGTLFETFGEELAYVKTCKPECVWTLIDRDGCLVVVGGVHLVNRLGYFITETGVITRTLCPEPERLEFLPRMVGKQFLRYEMMVYSYLDRASVDYHGGFWDYYTLSNGGFYMAPDYKKRFCMTWPDNNYHGSMSADAAGIAVNLFAQNAFAWEVDAEKFTKTYHRLRD